MKDFISIDFETANPKRVSACQVGLAFVENGEIKESKGYLIKPIGGHAPFQTKIHGLTEEDTKEQKDFKELFDEIKDIFEKPLVGHSLFDQQVLKALSTHFDLNLSFDYHDSSSIAKQKLPNLKNHKLKTLVQHFELPAFTHHDAKEDAEACAKVLLKLNELEQEKITENTKNAEIEFKGLALGILADDEVNYKEAYQLLYWLEDHIGFAKQHTELYWKVEEVLDDDHLDCIESIELKMYIEQTLKKLKS